MTAFRITFILLFISFFGLVAPARSEESSERIRVGLALGGGGMRGACHIGVLRAFEREGIPVDAVSGTSMGAIVGGLYCAGVSLDKIEDLLVSGRLAKSMAAGAPVARLPGMVCGKNTEGVFAGRTVARSLKKLIPANHQCINDLDKPFSAVVVDILEGREHALRTGDLAEALQASSAVPLLCQPVRTKDGVFVDGGVLNNLPVSHARSLGVDYVIAVEIDASRPIKRDATHTFPEVADRVIGLMLQRLDRSERDSADITLSPEVSKINFFSLQKAEIFSAINAGDRAATAAIPQIKECLRQKSVNAALSKLNSGSSVSAADLVVATPKY